MVKSYSRENEQMIHNSIDESHRHNAEQKKLDTQKKYRLHDYTYLNFKTKQSIIKKNTKNKCWSGCGEKGALAHCWWECKLVQLLWKTVWRFLKKLNIERPYDPAIPLLGIYPKKTKTLIRKDTCTAMFIAALFITAKAWKQPKCPSTDEWLKKKNGYIYIYIYTMAYYSAKKE